MKTSRTSLWRSSSNTSSPLRVRQFGGHPAQRLLVTAHRASGHYGHGEGKPTAAGHDLLNDGPLGVASRRMKQAMASLIEGTSSPSSYAPCPAANPMRRALETSPTASSTRIWRFAPMEDRALADVLHGFLEALGVDRHRASRIAGGAVGPLRSVLSGRRVLVVLDNARSTDQGRYLLAPGETRQVRR